MPLGEHPDGATFDAPECSVSGCEEPAETVTPSGPMCQEHAEQFARDVLGGEDGAN